MTNSGQSFQEFERAGWEDSGVVTHYHEHISGVTRQSVDALLDAAGITNASRVLDVATGAGYIAEAAKQRGADAIGVDFSAAQVRMACERHPATQFRQADAESLPFNSESFDAVVNGFGMCHLPNPDVGLREAFRVLKRGGRVAFTVWDMPERAVVFGSLYAAIRAHGSMDIDLPPGPDFFLLSDPERSTRALLSAGFVSPSCRQVPQIWRVSDADDIFRAIVDGSVRAAATLRAQSPSVRQAIKADLRETVAAYKRGDSFEVPMPALLATAVKP
jgi:SAM-dependent methyltransferase